MTRHFLTDLDLSSQEQAELLGRAIEMKASPGDYARALEGKILGMIFRKSSTRTRVSFEAGMMRLGGGAIFLSSAASQMGRGEPISDTGKVMSRYVDAVMIRTFDHDEVQGLAKAATVPVINGLDDLLHPCQALADLMTMREAFGEVKGRQLVYVGDGNNVANSLMYAGARAGVHVRIVTPDGFAPKPEVVGKAKAEADATGARIETTTTTDVAAAVEGADVIYTDVWASMGQENEAKARIAKFKGSQVDVALMARAKKDAIFLHCLPAHRGEEVAADVIDGDQSRVFDQAENRLHAQNAL
ncbi:MAG: ornithine carbamoyltransferase, partial [Myxococcota bacterium]